MSADTELILLRAFYAGWTEFHSIPKDRLHRRMHEVAAQDLVNAHNALKLLYEQAARPQLAIVTSSGAPIPEAVNEEAASAPA